MDEHERSNKYERYKDSFYEREMQRSRYLDDEQRKKHREKTR